MRLHNADIEVVTDKNRGDAIISFRRKGGKNIIDADDLRTHFDYHPDGYLTRKTRTSNRIKVGDRAGAVSVARGKQRRTVRFAGTSWLEHRLIWAWHHDEWPEEIDHINGDSSDNRIENLRSANRLTNMANHVRPKTTNRSGYLGVAPQARCSTFRAKLVRNGVAVHISYHPTAEEASIAYQNARKEYDNATA